MSQYSILSSIYNKFFKLFFSTLNDIIKHIRGNSFFYYFHFFQFIDFYYFYFHNAKLLSYFHSMAFIKHCFKKARFTFSIHKTLYVYKTFHLKFVVISESQFVNTSFVVFFKLQFCYLCNYFSITVQNRNSNINKPENIENEIAPSSSDVLNGFFINRNKY